MRQNKFKKGDIINNLIILDKDKIVTTNNGSKKTYWICKCKICGSIKSKSTQTIENCVSCCEFCNKAKRNITIDEFYNKCYKIVNKKIELDEKYFNIAKERIEKVESNG